MVKAPAPVRTISGLPKRFGNAAGTCIKHSKLCATSAGDISCISTTISVLSPPGQTQLLAPQEAQGTQIYIFTTGIFRVRGTMSVSPSVKPSLRWRVIDTLEMVTIQCQTPSHPHQALTLQQQAGDPGILILPLADKTSRSPKETPLQTLQQSQILDLTRTGTTDPPVPAEPAPANHVPILT